MFTIRIIAAVQIMLILKGTMQAQVGRHSARLSAKNNKIKKVIDREGIL